MTEAALSAWPLIVRDPDVRGGRACLAGTGVTVLALVLYRRRGWSAAKIQREGYPELPLSAIEGALAWAEAHRDEVLRDYAPPLVAVAGPEVDVGAELSPQPIPVSATRYERIEAAALALVEATRAPGPTYAWAAVWEEIAAARSALVAALCSCNAHGPDPECVEHGPAIRAWQKEHGT